MIGLILLVISLVIAGVGLYRAERSLFSRAESAGDASARQLDAAVDAFPVEASAPVENSDSRQPDHVATPGPSGDGLGRIPDRAAAPSGDGAALGGARTSVATDQILIVDLDQKVRSRLREILGGIYSVVEAENAGRAVAIMSRRQPALAIVGSNVKDRHGRPFWEWMRRSETLGEVPVMLISALTAQEDVSERFDHLPFKPAAVLRKPLLIDEVSRTVSRLMEGRVGGWGVDSAWGGDGSWGNVSIGSDEDGRFVRRAQKDVEQNIANPSFGVRELSSEMGLSARQLQRRLRETTGQSPNSFIRSIRLQQAALMLEKGSEPVSQVAYAVGFNSLSYFAKCFREHFGYNPSEFTTARVRAGAPA